MIGGQDQRLVVIVIIVIVIVVIVIVIVVIVIVIIVVVVVVIVIVIIVIAVVVVVISKTTTPPPPPTKTFKWWSRSRKCGSGHLASSSSGMQLYVPPSTAASFRSPTGDIPCTLGTVGITQPAQEQNTSCDRAAQWGSGHKGRPVWVCVCVAARGGGGRSGYPRELSPLLWVLDHPLPAIAAGLSTPVVNTCELKQLSSG